MKLYAQGDIVLELVDAAVPSEPINIDPDQSVVLARGEVTGHRHRFTGDSGVVMFRDDGLARSMAPELYVGHVAVPSGGANLVHEEHSTIALPEGTYRIRRQREWDSAAVRVVAD